MTDQNYTCLMYNFIINSTCLIGSQSESEKVNRKKWGLSNLSGPVDFASQLATSNNLSFDQTCIHIV